MPALHLNAVGVQLCTFQIYIWRCAANDLHLGISRQLHAHLNIDQPLTQCASHRVPKVQIAAHRWQRQMCEVNDLTKRVLSHRAILLLLHRIDRQGRSSLRFDVNFQSGDELLACRVEYRSDPLGHHELAHKLEVIPDW